MQDARTAIKFTFELCIEHKLRSWQLYDAYMTVLGNVMFHHMKFRRSGLGEFAGLTVVGTSAGIALVCWTTRSVGEGIKPLDKAIL